MSFKEMLLASLDETHGLYEVITSAGNKPLIAKLHAIRRESFCKRYADYFQQYRYKPALNFILSDVYSSLEHEARDEKVARAFSSMSKVLPDSMLETITRAVGFNCNMLKLDVRLVDQEIMQNNVYQYDQLLVNNEIKQLHVQLINDFIELAETIDHFVRKPFISMTLKASRIPAKAANLVELQDFLERCFAAFKTMRNSQSFLKDYRARELKLTEKL